MELNNNNDSCLSFNEQWDWFIRSIIIVRGIEDQFIPHSFEPGCVFMIFDSMNMIINCRPSMNNEIGSSGALSLSESLKINSSLTHLDLRACL